MPQMLTVTDLFSGCGGLSLGFEQAGFQIISSYDHWEPAVETCRLNFSHPIHLQELGKYSEVNPSEIIIGGPPCQGFSSAGKRNEEDERNTLVSVFSALVVRYQPKVFVFENVEGFLTQSKGRFIFDLLDPLINAGYQIHLRKINAAHYGVPQHRKRVLAIGGLGWEPTFPSSTHSALGSPGARLVNKDNLPFTPSLRQALEGLPDARLITSNSQDNFDHTYSAFNDMDSRRAKLLKPGQRMRDLPEDLWHDSYRKRAHRRVMDGTPTERRGGAPSGLRRLLPDEPSKAITGGAPRDFVHPIENRPLTIRECARLQTFPDDFLFIGSQGEKIKMIGNAVPIKLSKCIAASLAKDLLKDPTIAKGEGKLLSFIPTFSEGMSPVLKQVCTEVTQKYRPVKNMEQLSLCL